MCNFEYLLLSYLFVYRKKRKVGKRTRKAKRRRRKKKKERKERRGRKGRTRKKWVDQHFHEKSICCKVTYWKSQEHVSEWEMTNKVRNLSTNEMTNKDVSEWDMKNKLRQCCKWEITNKVRNISITEMINKVRNISVNERWQIKPRTYQWMRDDK